MKVFIVYCHPSRNSFTHEVKESFIRGLEEAGHSYVISDLYAMNFNCVFSESEYNREAFYNHEINVPEDVLAEQEKIKSCDVIAFIYPDFWTASPAMLEGWFQRVLTYGFAYGPEAEMKILKKAVFLVTMGGSVKDEIRQEQISAMKTVMIGDRMHNRVEKCEFCVFDEMTRGYGNDQNRRERFSMFTNKAYSIASDL